MEMITLTIDGKEVRTEEGRTILEAARENGISIPTLCHHKNLLPIGSCRLCIVEIEGYEKPMTSCTTAAVNGISVTTKSEKLFRMRQEYLKFLLINHPLECPICDAGGECQLQDLAFEHKIEKVDLTAERKPKTAKPFATALIRYSESRCVLCLRCIHACREVSGRGVLEIVNSGIEAAMAPVAPQECISCGECLFVCPVGALTEQESPLKSRKWQTHRQATTCPHCGFGCSLTLDVYQDRFITKVIGNTDSFPNGGSLCAMGRFGYDFANHGARVKTPSLIENGNARECTVADAAEATAAALKKLESEGKGIGFLLSPRATNEELYMITQIAGHFSKSVLGTAGSYHTGKVLDAFRRKGLSYSSNYSDIKSCRLVVVAGADLLANNHLLANKVREAVKTNGARVAVIDPSPTSLTGIADVWLKAAPGTDALVLNGIAKQLIDAKAYDPDAQNIEGFAGYAESLNGWEKQAAIDLSGVEEKGFDRLYSLFSAAENIAVIFGSGISASDEGMEALLNLCLLKGVQKNGVIIPACAQSNGVGVLSVLTDPVASHEALGASGIEGLFVYEDDPFHYLGGQYVEGLLKNKSFITVCDAFPTAISERANVSVPTGTFAEKEGSFFAEDGFLRKVKRARGSVSPGFEFLRTLLETLGGGLYRDEAEAASVLYGKEVIVKDETGRERLSWPQAKLSFSVKEKASGSREAGQFTLVLRNAFLNHHLSGKDVYSKLVHLNNPAIAGNKLFVSPEDAAVLGVSEGDQVVLTSEHGTAQERVVIKEGLKKGVLEYRMSKNRQDILKLAGEYKKHIAVTAKKG